MNNKTGICYATMMMLLAAVIAKVRASINARVPVGYQDEDGFHIGAESTEKEPSFPAFW